MFTWSRFGGYEVSSKGDPRFSAFNALLPDGRSIEQHYQCDVKGFDPGGTNWRLGKGKPPLNTNLNLVDDYVKLWRKWSTLNIDLMRELYFLGKGYDYKLSDCFATTPVNQANALSIVLNELLEKSNGTKR